MNLLYVFVLFMSFAGSAQAKDTMDVTGIVDTMWCGELDPHFGDTCLAFITTSNNQKYGLVLDFEAWLAYHSDVDSLFGRSLSATKCEEIADRTSINSLKDYNDEYFYIDCDVDFVKVD